MARGGRSKSHIIEMHGGKSPRMKQSRHRAPLHRRRYTTAEKRWVFTQKGERCQCSKRW